MDSETAAFYGLTEKGPARAQGLLLQLANVRHALAHRRLEQGFPLLRRGQGGPALHAGP